MLYRKLNTKKQENIIIIIRYILINTIKMREGEERKKESPRA